MTETELEFLLRQKEKYIAQGLRTDVADVMIMGNMYSLDELIRRAQQKQ